LALPALPLTLALPASARTLTALAALFLGGGHVHPSIGRRLANWAKAA
jgi:hypothetical protein